MAAQWTCLLADLSTNAITAEVQLLDVSISKVLNGSGTCTGSLLARDISRRGGDPYTLTTPVRTVLYALRDNRVWWGGIVWTRRYDSTSGRIDLGAADWWSYYDHRKIIPLVVGDGSGTASTSVSYTQVEQNQIARNLVSLADSHTGGDLGVVLDSSTSATLRDRTYLGYELVDVGEALRQLSQVEDGPDMMFDVGGDLDTSGRPVRLLRIGTPTLGQQGAPWVFEAGGNLLSYTWSSDGTRMATRAWATGDGAETEQLIAMAEDASKYGDGWPLLEAEEGYTTVSVQATLQAHANADQTAARLPVATPALTVSGQMSPAIGTYNPGDDARVIVADDFLPALDTRMRIIGISVRPGDGAETADLTMNPLVEDIA